MTKDERIIELKASTKRLSEQLQIARTRQREPYLGIPCTCLDDCLRVGNWPYKGTCGCEACHASYADFLSEE